MVLEALSSLSKVAILQRYSPARSVDGSRISMALWRWRGSSDAWYSKLMRPFSGPLACGSVPGIHWYTARGMSRRYHCTTKPRPSLGASEQPQSRTTGELLFSTEGGTRIDVMTTALADPAGMMNPLICNKSRTMKYRLEWVRDDY